MNIRLILFFLCAAASCKAPKNKVATLETTQTNNRNELQISNSIPANRIEFTVEGALIKNDSLIVSVAYSGGCEAHQFELYTNGLMAKSLPPQLNLTLVHTSKQDNCRNLIRSNQSFSIDTLSTLYQNKMLLRIANYDKPLLYQPTKTKE